MNLRKIAVLAVVIAALTGCTSVATEPDQQGLLYQGGPAEGRSFETCVKPATTEYGDVIGGAGYVYPAGTRTYTFDDPGDRPAIDIADKDGQPLTVSGILTFTLPNDCKVLQKFHERIGLKYGASDEGVEQWGDLLNDYLGQPLRAAMRDVAGKYAWRDLYSNPTVQDEFAAEVKEQLPKYVEDLAQGNYFTELTLLPQAAVPGGALLKQIEEQNTQTERLNTIEAQRLALEQEKAQIEELVRILGPQGYILYRQQIQCEEGGNCPQFVPIPQGSNLSITPGG